MNFVHKDCGGSIEKRKCTKCGKKWGLQAYIVAPDIILMPVSREERKKKLLKGKQATTYADWADSVPFTSTIAKLLPNWSRKWRILSFCIFYSLLIIGMVVLWKTNPWIAQTVIVLMVLPLILLGIGLLRKKF